MNPYRITIGMILILMGVLSVGGVPTEMNYQGRLLDADGQPVNTNVQVSISLHTNASSPVAVYNEDIGTVAVQNGMYSLHFGTNAAPLKAALLHPQCWMEVNIDGESLLPRQRLVATPYAIRSSEVEGSEKWDQAYGWGDHASGDATLQANLDAEGAARLTADGLLTTNLNQEIADRIAAVDAEASARTNADAVITADVATRLVSNVWAAADPTTNYLARTGDRMTGDLDMGANSITNIATNSLEFADGTSIGATNVHAWNAAYGWGDHASGDATLQANLDAEEAARLTADGLLTTNLSQEIADRIAAVDAEASARTNADAVITADVATRLVSNVWAAADSTTNYLARTGDRMTGDLDMGANSITNIATNSLEFADGTSIGATNVHAWNAAYGWGDHASGDATLQANLDAEEAARLTADGLLTTNLNQEIADRIAAVDAEASARTNADAVITADVATRLVSNVWAAADSTTNYLARTGGSMTGALALPAGGLTVGTTQLVVLANGNVGIGTGNPTNKLAVSGTIKAKEVIVTVDGWSDFVFEDGYRLMPLTEVDQFINSHGHLPGIPSARTVKRNGVRTGEMHARLLQKIEEMTLHLIRLERENAELRETIEDIRSTDSDESVDGGAWNAGGEE